VQHAIRSWKRARDLGMRVRTSQNVGAELTWTVNVVRVVAGAGEEAKILFAPHRNADALVFHGPLHSLH